MGCLFKLDGEWVCWIAIGLGSGLLQLDGGNVSYFLSGFGGGWGAYSNWTESGFVGRGVGCLFNLDGE